MTDSQLKYGVNTGYNGLFVTYAEIHLPEATEYTFTACGMGDIRVYIGTDYDNLEEIVSFIGYDSYNNNPVFDVTNSAKTFTIDGTKSQKIAIKIVVSSVSYNSNQRVEFCLGYLNGDTVSEIPSDWWYGANSYRYDEVSHYYSPYTTQSLYEILQNTISTTTRIDEDLTIIYQTCNLDDKFLTSTNSSSQSMDPGSIVIYKYNKAVTANYFQVTSASDVDNVLAFFEIYVSDNGIQWTEAFNGLCDFSSYSSAELNDGYTFQYVKLVFAEQYTGNYIDICNFEFQIRCEDLTIVDCPNDFSYSGNASLVGNNSNLNNNVLEFDNKIKFEFTGTSLLLFSNLSNDYGVIEVTVNEVTYQIDLSSDYDLYSQKILTIGCLEYDTYEVEIKVISGIGNLDYIAK